MEGRHCLGAANQSLLLLLQNSSNSIAQSVNCNGSAAPYLSSLAYIYTHTDEHM